MPHEANLREAALRHLARYAATEAQLIRVLDRRVERWKRGAAEEDLEAEPGARAAVRRVVAALVGSGVVNDAAYAAGRVRGLRRAGRSRAQMQRHLAVRGIGRELLREFVPEDEAAELAAAVMLVRRRRLAERDPGKAAAILARAGFSAAVARSALKMPAEDAEEMIVRLRHS